jgi:hypothetical protein
VQSGLLKKTEYYSAFALFPTQDPRPKFRFKVLFRKFHPMVNEGHSKDSKYQNSEYSRHKFGPNDSGSQNGSSLGLMNRLKASHTARDTRKFNFNLFVRYYERPQT